MAWYQNGNSDPAPLEYLYPQVVDAHDSMKIQGTLTEKSRTKVVTACAAEVERVLVKTGDTVEKGQLLASLKPLQLLHDEPGGVMHRLAADLDISALFGASEKCSIDYQGDPDAGMIFLFAPTGGLVLENELQEGGRIPAYSSCFVIADTEEMRIIAQVQEETVAWLQPEMTCSVRIDALGLSGLTGTLECLAPYASRQTSLLGQTPEVTTELQVLLDPADGLLPGYTATADFIVEEYRGVLMVPYACVGQDSAGEYVITIRDNVLRRLPVSTGKEFSQGVQILSGVTEQTPILAVSDIELDGKAVSLT